MQVGFFQYNSYYQRCLKTLTWSIFGWKIGVFGADMFFIQFFFRQFLPRTRVCHKQLLINARPQNCFDNPVTFIETRGKKWFISDSLFVYINCWWGENEKYQFSWTFGWFSCKKHVLPMFYHYSNFICYLFFAWISSLTYLKPVQKGIRTKTMQIYFIFS